MMCKPLKELSKRYELILGSGSPRRVKLLHETGVAFTQIIPNVDESIPPLEKPAEYVKRMAREKALSLIKELSLKQLVIGCDTIVVLRDKILGKPSDKSDALKMLKSLSGNKHTVYTSLAIANYKKVLFDGVEKTGVFFNKVTDEQILEYIDTGEPMDKAGAYGIQGMGAFLVDRIEGNLDTVIGFPRRLLNELADKIINLGIDQK